MTASKKAGTTAESVATPAENEKLKHSNELSGDEKNVATTRDDAHDLGVPMLQGDPSEPQGPEDALGAGDKRGAYEDRVGPPGYDPHTAEPIPADEQEEGGPTSRLVAQRPRASERGEVAGEKGGVTTSG